MPVARFSVTTRFYTVAVDATASTSDSEITSYDWDWGDGTTGAGPVASHTYSSEGTYTITLTITDANGETAQATWDVVIAIVPTQYRFPLELLEVPFHEPLNPGPVHDHDSVYIYRILPKPVLIELFFSATGLSYVEVYDADNDRFLLGERTEITGSTMFSVEWDGRGVFEVRVWKGSAVDDIVLNFVLPEAERIKALPPEPRTAPWILAFGLAGGAMMSAWRWSKR